MKRRILSVIMALVLCVGLYPTGALAEGSVSGSCTHHMEHTPDCGYMEAEPGAECTHEHTEDCYKTVEDCIHEHTESCYPADNASESEATPADAEEKQPTECSHSCSEGSGCITKELDCHHEHDESCGYREAAEGSPCTFVCEICRGGTDEVPEDSTDDNEINDGDSENPGTENGDEVKEPDDGQEECICEERCTEDNGNGGCRINTDCPVCGAEDASLSDCKGKDAEESTEDTEENTDQQEDTGFCKHHREHDDTCGYLPESEDSEGSLCTYECHICPVEELIAALPDKVTEDVRAQLDKILALFAELTEDEQEQIDLSRCYELQEALDGSNAPAPVTESVEYQEASWDGSQVTYESKTESCTLVENSTEAIEWTAGWYAVSGSVTISEPVTVSGEVRLILTDGCTLNAEKGIVVTTGNSLTIYAQERGTGTLNATGTGFVVVGFEHCASAGIGGGTETLDGGSITIHGGVINATGGSSGSNGYGGAGIGGGASYSENGVNSGTVTIYGGAITANSGEGSVTGAGIGGGGNGMGGGSVGNITIYGGNVTATSRGIQSGGAGIGGGPSNNGNGGSGDNITIYGGAVNATGGLYGAGIGGGGGSNYYAAGNGTVTISGGIVTAVGGKCAAGIGGGGGYQVTSSFGSINITGGIGDVTITGGIVDAIGGAADSSGDYAGAPIGNGGNATGIATVNKTTGIVFENGVGTVCGNVTFNGSYEVPAGYSLHILAGNSLSGSGTLTGGGRFTTDLPEEIISVPQDWHYTGEDLTDQIKGAVSLNGEVTICEKTFSADTDGWTLSVEKVSELEYTVKYTHSEKGTLSKTVTIAKGQPSLSDAAAYKADGTTPATTFGVGETIIIKATPALPINPAMFAASFTAPGAGQMAVYYGEEQISAPSTVENGVHTMTVDTNNLPPEALNKVIALKVKYIESDHASGADTEVKVTVTAVAKVEKDGATTLVDKTAFLNAFKDSANNGVTITMLNNVELTKDESITSYCSCTLDLNGHTISQPDITSSTVSIERGTVNIKDSGTGGEIRSGNIAIGVSFGTVSIESGTVSGSYVGVQVTVGSVNISGTAVISGGNNVGLLVERNGTAVLSGGTFTGRMAIEVNNDASVTLKGLLAQGYAYHRNDLPITKAEGWVDSSTWGEVSLDTKANLAGPVTVKQCEHTGEGVCTYTHTSGTTTHQKTCLACGNKWDEENCSFGENGKCACEAVLAVALKDNTELTYTGEAQTPEVNVTVDGIVLVAEKYQLSYDNNINAGNTAKVTVTGTTFTGTFTLPFTIKPATPTLAWESTTQELTYTGNEAMITAPKATGVNGTQLGIIQDTGPCQFSYATQGSSEFTNGLPINAGTYTIKASIAAKGNYTAAESTNTLTLTINKAPGTLTVPETQISRKYGDAAFSLNCSTNGDGRISYKSSKEDVASVSADGTVLITGAGTAVITVSLEEGANYSAAGDRTITVYVDKKDGYTVETLNRSYLYSRENTDSIDLAALLPKDCGTVAYGPPQYRKDWVYSTAPAVTDGKLSYTLGTGNINDEDSITVTVTTRNYADITITIKAKLTDRIPVELKEGTEVTLAGNTLTYGESLSKLEFNNAVFVDGAGNTVEGNLAWKDATARPNAGTTSAVWVFTPTDQTYAPVEGTAAITVNKAVPAVSAAPTVAGRVYDPLRVLEKSDLSGGIVGGVDGMELAGEWSWQSADIVPTVNNSGYVAVFIPTDITNYETVTRTITMTVEKATPYIAVIPVAAGITYGETLKDSSLTGGNVQYGNGAGQAGNGDGSTTAVSGTFTWKEPSVKPAVADSNMTEYTVIFTPSDTADYNPAETKVKLTVNKAQNAPNMPGSAMDVSNSIEKAGDVPLPEGWEWQTSDKDTALEAGVAVNAVAVYTGADKGNYEKETVTVAITRSACDHTAGDVLYTDAGERAPTCRADGLGHRECTKCGAVTESGVVVKALGHIGGTATCSSRAVCTRCGQPYGGTDGNIHGSTQVRGSRAATCTAGGYTGDSYCKDCGAKTKAGSATPALGHNYTNTVTKEPTTGSEGIRTYTCTRCGHKFTESIPKLPEETHRHSYTESVTKQPNCTDTGVRTHACSCGDSYTETIAALGHHYQSSETRKPTATAEGVMTYTCDRCGHSYTRPIEKLPGEGTTDPGTSQPGETEPGGGNAEETTPKPGRPFIKGEDGKTGWDVIRAEEEKAQEGSSINVDMNGSVVVPGDIFDSIKGRDIVITFDMGNGILWSVDGKSITTDKAGDIDFSVKTGVDTVPVDIINNATGERYSIQISLAYEGEFGFTAALSINLGKENAGYTASLYYYNESTGELEFICADEVSADGTVSLAFTHASDYVIAIDGEQEEESGNATGPVQPESPDTNGTGATEESPQTGLVWRPWWIVAVGLLVIVMGIGVFFVVKKKQEADS